MIDAAFKTTPETITVDDALALTEVFNHATAHTEAAFYTEPSSKHGTGVTGLGQ